jgi:hypothetical protein
MHATSWLVVPCALFFLWMGCVALVRPRKFARLLELDANTPLARSEVRAVYGGYGVAMAGALLVGLLLPRHLAGIAATVGAAMTGLAAGRLISCWLDRAMPRMARIFTALELGLALLLFGTLALLS